MSILDLITGRSVEESLAIESLLCHEFVYRRTSILPPLSMKSVTARMNSFGLSR